MSGIVSFVNQIGNQEIPVSYTTYNPLAPPSNNNPSSGQWYYYLLQPNSSSPLYLNINVQNIPKLYITLIGQGGYGPNPSSNSYAFGGGGGGGPVLTQTYTLNSSVTTTLSCTLGAQTTTSPPIPTSITLSYIPITYTLGLASGGGAPTEPSESTGAVGGNGGNGGNSVEVCGGKPNFLINNIFGGAGGNGGAAYNYSYKEEGTPVTITLQGIQGQPGTSYNGATNAFPGQGTGIEAPPAYTPITFADGLKGNLADGGMQNQSGNYSAIMVYYMESIDNGEDTDDIMTIMS